MTDYSGQSAQALRGAGRLLSVALLTSGMLVPGAAHAQTLPLGWTGSNIGKPAVRGRATYVGGTLTVEGQGTRIGYASDEFFFVSQRLTGDVAIVARIGSVENTDPWAKAGVMIRESLAADSAHAFALVTPGRGIGFHRRPGAGEGTTGTNISGAAPEWLKLVRSGSTVTASRSADGINWTIIDTDIVPMGNAVYVGVAVASYDARALATATFSSLKITSNLPAPWSSGDIGSPALRGRSAAVANALLVSGAGKDIWGTSDQFRYVYQQVSGDVDVVARVAAMQGPDAWSKAGLMIRASLAANSAHASMFVSQSQGLAFQRRPATGLNSLHTSGGSAGAPMWVKLERRGTSVTAFRSSTGTSWTMVGSETLTLPSTFYVGLAVTSHDVGASAAVLFTNVAIAGAAANGPPTISITAPTGGATYNAPATIALAANASDKDGIASVDFYANGAHIGTDTTSPYGYPWYSVPAGIYSLTAVARDTRGATARSAPVSVTVKGSGGTANTPPTVSLTSPANAASFTAPASVTVSANASDADGIARVDFYAGTTLIGTDASSPYSVTWNNVGVGVYVLTAVARDNKGAAATSSPRGIIVGGATSPKRAIFNPSPSHATVLRYVLDIIKVNTNPASVSAVASQNLGKPPVVNGDCTADISATVLGLPKGTYFATVVAVGSKGTSTRAISAPFIR